MTDAAVALPEQLPATGPFKGLANYTEQDAAFFFGRDREREVIIANLKARRLTLLYGESGVGKSSLLRAGVVADLLAVARENMEELGTPEYLPVVYSSWRDDPVAGLIDAIAETVERVTGRQAGLSASRGLEEAIQAAARAADAYLLIILDQFEEYFLYHPDDDVSEAFAEQFPRAVNRDGLQAGFLVAIREDALAKLDRFKGEIPRLFDTFLRIDHLDAAAAHEAIVGPVEEYNRRAPEDRRVWLDPVLIDAVLNQVRTGQVVLEQAGHGTVQPAGPIAWADDRIETPYLQLVMARLWDEERRHGFRQLRVATLDALGGAQEIVRTHLDASLSNFTPAERDVVADLFHHLVTPSGSKIAHGAGDLAEYVRRPEPEVAALLEKLAARDTRIVRAVAPPPGDDRPPRYEIFHDVLAPSVLDWRSRQTAARRAEEQRRAARAALRRRLFWLGGMVGLVLFGVIVWLAVEANSQRDAAQNSARLSAKLAKNDSQLTRLADAQRQAANQQKNRAINADRAARRAAGAVRKENGLLTAQATQLGIANRRASAFSSSLAVQAQTEAGLAAKNGLQAQRLAVQARTETGLAAAQRRSADRAQLELAFDTQSISLGHTTPQLNAFYELVPIIGRPSPPPHAIPLGVRFNAPTLAGVPAGAVVYTWGPGHPGLTSQTIVTGAHAQTVKLGAITKPYPNALGFDVEIDILVTLRDVGWLYRAKTGSGNLRSPLLVISQGQCRPAGSRESASQLRALCPVRPA